MDKQVKFKLLISIFFLFISQTHPIIFDQEAEILNPSELFTFSSISPSKGPIAFGDNILITKDSSVYVLDLSGQLQLSFPTGESISGSPKESILNGNQVFSIASGNKIFVFNNEKILHEITLNDSTAYDHEIIDADLPKLLVTFNYPALIYLNGSLIWQKNNLETRGIIVTDLEKDDNLDLVFSAEQLIVLDLSGNTKWSQDIFCIQPPKVIQLDSNQAQEILCPTQNELIAIDSSGNILWQVDQNHAPSEQTLVEAYGNQIIEAVTNKLIFRDLAGRIKKEIITNVTPKSLDLVDINANQQKDYLISDDISIHSFTNEDRLWSLNIKEGVQGLTLVDVDKDNFLEILVGTREGIKVIDHKEEPILATFTVSQNPVLIDQSITLDASLSKPEGTLHYRWDFESDGIFDTEFSRNPQLNHSYFLEKEYRVILEVTDGSKSGRTTREIHVFKTNEPPTIRLTTSRSVILTDSELLLIAAAQDREGDNLEYRFDVDSDGLFETSWQNSGSFKTTAEQEGKFTATAEVRDSKNPAISSTAVYEVKKPEEEIVRDSNPNALYIISISMTLLILVLIVIVFIYSKRQSKRTM